MSLYEPTHGRHRDSDGDLDVPDETDQNGPWIHRQMNGQNRQADRSDDRPDGALSDLGIDGDANASRAGSDPEQLSAAAHRFEDMDSDGESDSDETAEAVVTSSETTVLVRASAGERAAESTERYDGMQSHLGRRPESVSCVEGYAVSDIAAFRARGAHRADDEPDPCIAQASGYLARD